MDKPSEYNIWAYLYMYRVFDNMKTLHRKIDPKSSAFFNSKYITPRGKEIATAETLIGLTESNASKHEEYELHDDGGIGGNIASRTTVKKIKEETSNTTNAVLPNYTTQQHHSNVAWMCVDCVCVCLLPLRARA